MPFSHKESVRTFVAKLSVVVEGLTEAQCAALEEAGTLSALSAAITAARAGQLLRSVNKDKVTRVVTNAIRDLFREGT